MKKRLTLAARALGAVLMIAALLVPAAAPTRAQDAAPGGRLVLLSKLDGPPLPENIEILEQYGDAFVLARLSEGQLAALPEANVYDRLADRTVISLNGTTWDTQQGEPAIADSLRSAPGDPYFLVQFYAPIKKEWKADLEAMGVTFLGYHPNYTYIVRMDPALVDRVRAAHAVQWVGAYHPAYRLASQEDLAKAEVAGDGRVALQVRGFPDGDTAALQADLERAGASIWLAEQVGPPVLWIWAAPEMLPRLAALPGVYRVEGYDQPVETNDKAVQSSHMWDVWKAGRSGLLQDLMGAGQIAGSVDSGLDNKTTSPTIEDFYDWTNGVQTTRVQYNANSYYCTLYGGCSTTDNVSGHGTHTSGSIVGNGYNSLQQRGLQGYARTSDPSFDYAWGAGMAPEAKIAMVHAGTTGGGIGTVPATDWVTLYNQGARNVNNSWGNSTYTYGGNSITADNVMWNYQDHLIVVSAGNTGPSTSQISQPANAKNVISAGGSTSHRSVLGIYLQYADTTSLLAPFSALGPVTAGTTGDIRFKPDIVTPGAQVLSTRTNQIAATTAVGWGNDGGMDGGDGDGDNDLKPDYAYNGGTSMSAPLVTGAATVVRDYFQDIQGMGATTPPSAALIKAALLNGAVDMGYGYESNTSAPFGGRNMQGWGFLNVEQAITPRAPRSFFFDDFTDITNSSHFSTKGPYYSGDYVIYTVSVTDSSEPLKVTLTWTDEQGGSDGYAVNDLDLLLQSPGGSYYYGNNFSGSWTSAGGSPFEGVNNTEAIYVQNPPVGTWTIQMNGYNLPSYQQPYALFVSGGLGANPTYTRTCYFTNMSYCGGRLGSSGQTYGGTAVDYFPSLKPLAPAAEHVPAGQATAAQVRLTNWGRLSDSINLSYAVTTMTGAAASNITVAFDQANPIALASGASVDVWATVSVGAAVANGSYDVLVTATSANTGNRKDAIVLPLNVIATEALSNQEQVAFEGGAAAAAQLGPQVTPDLWASGQTLWAAYLSGESHINGHGEVWAACSTDGGGTWINAGQVDAGDGALYYRPVVAGKADGSSVTFVWIKPHSGVYARTWVRTSGCTGTWRSIVTLASYTGAGRRVKYPDVIYDTGGRILATWQMTTSDSSTTEGIFSAYSTNDGVSYTAAAGVPDASGTDATHNMGQLALDTANNDVWMAYSYSSSDIYIKRWRAGTWQTGTWIAANTSYVEARPAIGYVSGTASLWVTWHSYYLSTTASQAQARLNYRRTTGTLPTISWGTAYQYPTGVRTAEDHPAMVVGDASYSYITYVAQSDSFRGGNIYALKVPAAGGAPSTTFQVTATVDDPPLYARGNAGAPTLVWATTLVNGNEETGPAVLFSKNPPENQSIDYSGNLGVLQTLYNLEENVDLYLGQLGITPTAVELKSFKAFPEAPAVHVRWETVQEIDNLGFNLYRSNTRAGLRIKLNAELIPSLVPPGSPFGAVYDYLDTFRLRPGRRYFYWLEAVDLYGNTETFGPARAVAP